MDRFKKFAIHLLLLATLVFGTSLAHAEVQLNIPQPLEHAGLTFIQPLITVNEEKLPVKPLSIRFETQATALTNMLIAYEAESVEIEESIDEEATVSASPTQIPTPTPTVTTTPTVIVTQTGSNTSSGGLNADVLFSMSNNYRIGKGLAPFQTDARICSLAAARAPQISAEIAEGHMHSGKDSHNFPYRFTENIITMRTEAEAFNWWVNDYIHRVQIEENNTHSCVACAGNACTQEFTSFQPR
ncbi:MAG TPA: CAP domain-containing protein [Xanthomonadales bacterium]|nr:CAP domain-containing protein [Xanthomonadales bacterium]